MASHESMEALSLCVAFVALPTWRGPLAAACSWIRNLLAARRAHALQHYRKAHGCAATFRGRLRIDTCRACGAVRPVYPLSRGDVARVRHNTYSELFPTGVFAWPGNRLAAFLLLSPSQNDRADDPRAIVAWLCDQRRCGGHARIADPAWNVLMQEGIW